MTTRSELPLSAALGSPPSVTPPGVPGKRATGRHPAGSCYSSARSCAGRPRRAQRLDVPHLTFADAGAIGPSVNVRALPDVLAPLAAMDPSGGACLTSATSPGEESAVLGVSTATASRKPRVARAWLRRALGAL